MIRILITLAGLLLSGCATNVPPLQAGNEALTGIAQGITRAPARENRGSHPASDISDFLRIKFRADDVVFIGEDHSAKAHKTELMKALQRLSQDNTIVNFAFEFSRHSESAILQKYLNDPSADAFSLVEESYLKQLNRKYTYTFANSDYDNVLRLMRHLHQQFGTKFCALDELDSKSPNDIRRLPPKLLG